MATITQLSDDAIIIILENETISVEDVVNFKSTCKRFQQMTISNKFWERKYYQCCPTAEKNYSKEKQEKIFQSHIDFKQISEAGLYDTQKLQSYALTISKNMLCNTDKKQLECLLRSIAENSLKYYFVWDQINGISAQKSCKLFSNLTYKYNFKLIFHYLKQHRFIHQQIKFMNMPKTKFLLEKQFTIVAQYFQPRVTCLTLKTWFDSIVHEVLFRLKNKYPSHSICSTASEQFSFWRDNNIYDNFWNETESHQIICILEEYIFSELESYKLHELLMTLDLEAKYVKYVLQYFRIYLLIVTYHIVARRFGIHSILKSDNVGDIEIIWKPKYNTSDWDNWNNSERVYINYYQRFPSSITRKRFRSVDLFKYSDVMQSSNYILITYELISKFNNVLNYYIDRKWDFNIILNCLSRYSKDFNKICIKSEYKNITNTIEIRSNKVKRQLKRRTKRIKFAVGLCVTHTMFGHTLDDHDGVIIAWYHRCNTMLRDKFQKTIKFPYLRRLNRHEICKCVQFSKDYYQPHYLILTENNVTCYVKQDQLLIRRPRRINNIEIGKYFSSFKGTHYLPNENLRQYYPEDTAAIFSILAK